MSDTPADRLRKARIARGYSTAAEAARAFGWPVGAYTHHENGTRGIRTSVAERYARAYGIPAASLMGLRSSPDHVESAPVIGKSAVGVWRDNRLDASQNDAPALYVAVPRTELGEGGVRFAVEICDASVNRALEAGDYAICRPVNELELDEIPVQSLVWVERRRHGLTEQSIRMLTSRQGARMTLSSFSRDPRLNDVITVPPSTDGETVTIKGRVIARYAPLNADED